MTLAEIQVPVMTSTLEFGVKQVEMCFWQNILQLVILESYDLRSKIFKYNSVIQSQNTTKNFSGLFLCISKVAFC